MQWTAASCDQHDQHDPPAVNRNSIEQRTPANNCEVDPMDATGSTKHPHLPKQREADRPVSGSGGGSSSLTLSGAVTTSMEVTVSTTTTTTIIESSSSTNTTLEKNSPSPAGGSCSSGSGSLSPAYLQHHLQHHGSPLHHLQVHHHTAPPSPLAAVRSAQMGSSVANGAGPAAACLAVCCSPGSSHHHLGHVGHLATGHPLPHQLPHQLPHPSLYPLMAAAQLGYAGSSGPSSLVNSPALGRRKRYTSNSSNCSSQFNNNYAGLDVDSLDDMLRKLTELEQRVIEAEERAEEAEDKVRAMEQRLSEWPKPPPQQAQHPHSHSHPHQPIPSHPQEQQAKNHCSPSHQASGGATAGAAGSGLPPTQETEKTITSLEIQVEEQRQLRLHDARQIEAKAAKIKEWVNNKLRDLEEQNQLLREQNVKCNQQLELLKNHIANQSQRHSIVGPVRNSLSLDVQDFTGSGSNPEHRRRSESLDPQEIIGRPLTSSYPHHQHRRNLSMEPQELERNLVAAVDGLTLAPLSSISNKAPGGVPTESGVVTRPDSSDTDTAHDYAEIYTPSCEKLPAWMKNNPALMASGGNSSTTTTTTSELGVPRPPTPPLHRFPSWEAKIYQVANDGLAGAGTGTSTAESTASQEPDIQDGMGTNLSNGRRHGHGHGSGTGIGTGDGHGTLGSTPGTPLPPSRQQQTASGGFCDISVPVYATVKGRASQIRSMPFTGDSSDDSSDGEDHAVMLTHHSHNSSSTDNTETSTSGSASSPSKSLKTSSSLSPAKRSGSESPKNAKARVHIQSRTSTTPSSRINQHLQPSQHQHHTLSNQNHGHQLGAYTVTPSSGQLSLPRYHANALQPGSLPSPLQHMRGTVISDLSFESGLSDDYALPPDAVSESTCMDASMPSLLMRQSYVDSPSKKIESLEKMGHLAKLGGKLKTWRKRWFVLKNGSLNYWKSQHDVQRKPQGQIQLDEVCRINRAEGASTFEIDTGKKVYYLTADSHATMDDWIRVLQNVQRRNATKLLLSRDDQKPTVQGWVTKVKNGHPKKCWCVLLGKMFLYFKAPAETNPLGQINMRDARVEEVEHVSDSDSEEREDAAQDQARLTVAIYPAHQGPTYLILSGKPERDNWLYHLTVVSGGGPSAGTQYEQLVQKLMETDGDPNCVLWRHPILLHTKDTITAPLSSMHTETMQPEAIKLFKSIQLFMSVAVNQPGIDYHVVLAQNALQHALDMPELQTEMICILIKQTSRHLGQKLSVGVQVNKKLGKQTRQLLLCATQSLFTCDTQQAGHAQANGSSPTSIQAPSATPIIDCKSNPPVYSFVQGWQLLALAVSLFVPRSSRLLWYLKLHLSRNADTKTETGKYAAYCERALERTLKNGGRETKPSRMEVLSILLKNPYHHSLPHAIPVHMMNSTYQVVSFDGSTTIEEFQATLAHELGTRDATNGFCLFSDDPIEKDLEHYLEPLAKLCDVISKWETALREKGSGKFENSRVIQLSYKNRLYWKHTIKCETDKERLLLCYQTNSQIVQGRFPLSRELALELASLMSQIDMGDYSLEKSRDVGVGLKGLDKFYPYRYRDALGAEQLKDVQELLVSKWMLLKGRSTLDCVRIYLTCCRKWPYFGACLFQAKPRQSPESNTASGATPVAWLAVAEDALNVLELSTMAPVARYPYSSVMTFGGCQDDFMLVVSHDDGGGGEQKLLFAMSKPKILEITLLIADYMNALGHTVPGTPQMNSLTRNGSHRSLRTSQRPNLGGGSAVATGFSTNATTTAHNTLNSHATHTLNSNHSHTLSSSHHAGGGSQPGTLSSGHHQHHHIQQHHQPDILKSTPDHQRIK
uniref:Uncharacterized protein CG43867 n=1 Tax=Drosophila melanogaster TaxID=7227 RepID=Y34F_DROME|nr:uncharacterized protein Dmel_CG43867, isoform D [Drosophila melanogaster]Q9W5D0.4 RecName: Full=Uncharacterized protein CG43867 [Drosophila melanogaster]ABW09321.2 uncharacterized protein Dmel_CG43867, isoform D [Drosophila melanogaster]|eukprot:NP_001096860.2 uncharacterized protein Dmel_CG43867, isoform D [Drosophila melanogaster]